MTIADAGPHAPLSTALYLLRNRVDYLPGTHLPKQTRGLAGGVGAAMRERLLACFGTGVLDFEGQCGSRYKDDPSHARGLFEVRRSNSAGAASKWPSDERLF